MARILSREVYIRRALFAVAVDRLEIIRQEIEAFDTKHTGKVYRDEYGDAVGRGKGVMPSMRRTYPELRNWEAGPARLVKTIREKKSADYLWLLGGALEEVDATQGDRIAEYVQRASADELKQFPPVLFEPHTGRKSCRHCKQRHSADVHRFHTSGAFARTHPTPEEKQLRKRKREESKGRGLPAWVTEGF